MKWIDVKTMRKGYAMSQLVEKANFVRSSYPSFLLCLLLLAFSAIGAEQEQAKAEEENVVVADEAEPGEPVLSEEEKAVLVRLNKAWEEVGKLRADEKFDEAVQSLDKILAVPEFQLYRAFFFRQKILILLESGRAEEAEKLACLAWQQDPDMAALNFGTIFEHYQEKRNTKGILEFCDKLALPATRLPEGFLPKVAEWRFRGAMLEGKAEDILAAVKKLYAAVPEGEVNQTLQNSLTDLLTQKKYDLFDSLIQSQEVSGTSQEQGFRQQLQVLTVRSLIQRMQWEKIEPVFQKAVREFPDAELLKLSREIFTALRKNGQMGRLLPLSEYLYKTVPAKVASANFAAGVWMDRQIAAGKKGELPELLQTLLSAKVGAMTVSGLFDRYFYEVYTDPATLKRLCDFGERMLQSESDEGTRKIVIVKLLDGAFILDDYPKAISMLEKGIPDKDKEWHEMTLPKVRAHYSLKRAENEKDEAAKKKLILAAIQDFRAFMNVWIRSERQEEYDPTSGIPYCKAWILGRNADRISKLYSDIRMPDEAKQVREEAKKYFQEALEKSAKEPEALKLLKKEVAPYGL